MEFNKIMKLFIAWIFFSLSLSLSQALEVNITDTLPYIEIEVDGKVIRVQRIQDVTHKLTNEYSKTSRPVPPFSIQPFEPIKGVDTVSELDVLSFLTKEVNEKKGILMDTRIDKWHKTGTIPGATHIPFLLLSPKKNYSFTSKLFDRLGATKENNEWDFSNVQTIMVFDNGPWCSQAVYAIKWLIVQGYPKDKIKYYRGGMQYWQILGLTTITNIKSKGETDVR